ncbi:MAG: DUF2442 domain-containing protein [Deltaproteobacteria bacterium]|nr:DUF2442 domain-containing protein [Deltaproteobacteria bacterium]
MGIMGRRVRVLQAEPLSGFRAAVSFEDGTKKEIDLEVFLRGPIFETIRGDPAIFRAMEVRGGTIAWDNGADIDPDVLYYDLRPAWMEGAGPPECAGVSDKDRRTG